MHPRPYENGALFPGRLEKALGRDKLDAFLKGYFDPLAVQGLTTADFKVTCVRLFNTAARQ